MTRVHISSDTHTVTVDHDGGDLADVLERAQKLWEATKPDEGEAMPMQRGMGFTTRQDPGLQLGGSKRRGGDFAPVRAGVEDARRDSA